MVKIATIRAVAELQVGCATAQSRVVRVGTLGLHYLEWGSADHPPLLFLHGGSAHAHWFDAVAPASSLTATTSCPSTSGATAKASGPGRPRTRPRTLPVTCWRSSTRWAGG